MSWSMSWTSAYRVALHLLPAGLRRKHGGAMEALYARDLGRARARGRLEGALVGAAGVWDVVRRGAYEQVRPRRDVGGDRSGHRSRELWNIDAHGPQSAGANLGGPLMPQPTTAQLLRRHAVSFAVAFVVLTASLLAHFAARQLPRPGARGELAELLLLAVPFIAAMTIPMAVLIAVLREFTRLGADGTLAAARRERGGVRRLVLPVLGATAGVAALALVVTAEIVPRANARLSAVLAGGTAAPSDRTMTIGELREAARSVRLDTAPIAVARAAGYEVEVQKKLALPAACVVLALAGIAIALLAPRGGTGLVIGASGAVFATYYMLVVAGEGLADRLVVSPFVGMWGANALLLAAALLVVWRSRAPLVPSGGGAGAIRG